MESDIDSSTKSKTRRILSACSLPKPITPPERIAQGVYRYTVEYNKRPFLVTWSGSTHYPEMENFPDIANTKVQALPQTPAMESLWRGSELMDYGAHASIRLQRESKFPILKLTHAAELSMKLIASEFEVLLELQKSLPVPRIDPIPLKDHGIVSGFRMELLSKLGQEDLAARAADIEQAVGRLHSAGFCHGDLSLSNIMVNEAGQIILIDLSFAGRIGHSIPSFFPDWVYEDVSFDLKADIEALTAIKQA